MKKIMDKLGIKIAINKKMFFFLIGLMITGIIAGSVLVVVLNKTDQALVSNYLSKFFDQIGQNELNYTSSLLHSLLANILFVLIIWLLGISVVGIPVMLFMYFSKAFILGFSIASLLINYKLKGVLFSLAYVFPHHIISLLLYTLLMIYAMSVSMTLINSFLKKKTIDFKIIMNKYRIILLICIVGIVITSLLETYLMPNLIRFLLPILK